MVRKLSGVYSEVNIGSFTPDIAVSRGAIGVIGHMASGTNITNNDKFSSSNPYGTVHTFNSIIDAKATLGDGSNISSGSTWYDGTFGSGAVAGYDPESNLIRALELIYLGNPGADCRVCVLSGSGTDAKSTPNGTSEAIAELMKMDDISFLYASGLEFNSTVQASAISSDSDTNQAERIYVGGISLNEAYSGSTDINKQNTFGVSAYTSLAEDKGRSICLIGNSTYQFKTGWYSGSVIESTKEIGANWISAYYVGYLSSLPEHISTLNKGVGGFLPVYNGKPKIWSNSELKTNYDNSMISVRYSSSNNPAYYWEKAMTFAPKTSAFGRITRMRIIDRVTKDVRVILSSEKGKPNIENRRKAINDRIRRKLLELLDNGLLTDSVSSNVYVQSGDVANNILRASVGITPVGEIEEIILSIGVNLV